jgi:hypothetical protein
MARETAPPPERKRHGSNPIMRECVCGVCVLRYWLFPDGVFDYVRLTTSLWLYFPG